MICALIIAFTIKITQLNEISNQLDILITNVITKPEKDHQKDIDFVESQIKYLETKNDIEDLKTSKAGSVLSLYRQIVYEVEYYIDTKDERLIKSMVTNKIFADNILDTIDTNKKGS